MILNKYKNLTFVIVIIITTVTFHFTYGQNLLLLKNKFTINNYSIPIGKIIKIRTTDEEIIQRKNH